MRCSLPCLSIKAHGPVVEHRSGNAVDPGSTLSEKKFLIFNEHFHQSFYWFKKLRDIYKLKQLNKRQSFKANKQQNQTSQKIVHTDRLASRLHDFHAYDHFNNFHDFLDMRDIRTFHNFHDFHGFSDFYNFPMTCLRLIHDFPWLPMTSPQRSHDLPMTYPRLTHDLS